MNDAGIGGTGAVLVAQVEGGSGGVKDADGGLAVAVPVADDREPAGGTILEGATSGAPELLLLRRYQVAVVGSKTPAVA